MKKLILVALVALSLVMLAGCGSSSSTDNEATDVVKTFLDAIKVGDFEEAFTNFETVDESMALMDSNPFAKELFGEITYKVIKSEISDTTATVKVKVTHPDYEEIMTAIQKEVLEYTLSLADGDLSKMSEEDSEKMLEKIMKEVSNKKDYGTKDSEGEFKLELVDDKWIIQDDTNFSKIFGLE